MSLKEMAEGEFMESIMENLLPKVKIFAPKIIKGLEESDEFLAKDELLVIGKGPNGKIFILKGKSDDIDIVADKSKLQKYDLNYLVDGFMSKVGK